MIAPPPAGYVSSPLGVPPRRERRTRASGSRRGSCSSTATAAQVAPRGRAAAAATRARRAVFAGVLAAVAVEVVDAIVARVLAVVVGGVTVVVDGVVAVIVSVVELSVVGDVVVVVQAVDSPLAARPAPTTTDRRMPAKSIATAAANRPHIVEPLFLRCPVPLGRCGGSSSAGFRRAVLRRGVRLRRV
jgi:hypothetical protein